jgi:hypothetical protein
MKSMNFEKVLNRQVAKLKAGRIYFNDNLSVLWPKSKWIFTFTCSLYNISYDGRLKLFCLYASIAKSILYCDMSMKC